MNSLHSAIRPDSPQTYDLQLIRLITLPLAHGKQLQLMIVAVQHGDKRQTIQQARCE